MSLLKGKFKNQDQLLIATMSHTLFSRTLCRIWHDKETSFTKLKGHSSHFLSSNLIKNSNTIILKLQSL